MENILAWRNIYYSYGSKELKGVDDLGDPNSKATILLGQVARVLLGYRVQTESTKRGGRCLIPCPFPSPFYTSHKIH